MMLQKPRLFSNTFFNRRELATSILQGLAITVGTLATYQFAVRQGSSEDLVRTMVFLTLISANVFLTLVNRSFYYSVISTSRYKNNLVLLIISLTIALMIGMLFFPPVTKIFRFEPLTLKESVISIVIGFISVIWYEAVKFFKRLSKND